MALQGGHGSILRAVFASLASERRSVRQEAPSRHQPSAAGVSGAAGQENPA